MGYIVDGSSLKKGSLPVNKIVHGDALEVLRKLPDNSIDCVITSPPYWAQREYSKDTNKIWGGDKNCEHEWVESPPPPTKLGAEEYTDPKYASAHTDKPEHGMFCRKCSAWFGQLGLEPTPEMFVDHLIEIFREVKRVLKPNGNLFVNIDDTFARSQGWKSCGGLKHKEGEWEYDGAPRKSLCLIPELFAIKMVYELGFTLRQKIIWTKKILIYKEMETIGNAMPESAKDRQMHAFEFIYHFTKSPKYYYNQLRKPVKEETVERMERSRRLVERTGLPITSKNKYYQSLISGGVEKYGCAGIVTGRFMQNTSKYNGKFNGIGEDAEKYGSPRARTQRRKYDGQSDISFAENLSRIRDEMREKGLPEVSPLGAIAPDVVLINTEPFSESHFAVFPTNLVRFLLEIGCPEKVCSKCGMPYDIFYNEVDLQVDLTKYGASKNGDYRGKAIKDYETANAQNPSDVKRRILNSLKTGKIISGLRPSCNCNSSHESGIVLDPFLGSGTTAIVALQMGYRFIGIELSKEYCKIAEKRIKPYLDQKSLKDFFDLEVAEVIN